MSTRDRTGEILEVKERNPLRHRFGSYGLQHLKSQWTKTGRSDGSTPDFYVIRAVTLLEVFTRGNIAELIDHGTNYANRALELSKNLKMDFALIQGIQGRAITLGDIVAHSVPVNSFAQILGYFETLLGKPLRPLLVGAIDRWATEIEKKAPDTIIDDFDLLARSLARLLEVRHILCHETPRKSVYALDEIDEFLNDAVRFTKALEALLTFEMFGLVPLRQSDMNIAALESLRKKEDELAEVLSEIRANAAVSAHVGCQRSLDDAEDKWLLYRNAQCEFYRYFSRDGTISTMLWAVEATRLTEVRIAELRSWLKLHSEN
jgi:uncharacterized protein YecT (DUF1311 family)